MKESLWPNLEKALNWIDIYGDTDKDGFVEYSKQSEDGLIQQGWKDSYDSVFKADGSVVQGSIALCEVQGYVYAAKMGLAKLALKLNKNDLASKLIDQANDLKERFEKAFWLEELGIYALALDKEHQPCKVRASNAGHVLFGGLATQEKAKQTAKTLLSEHFFSGWGIRTVSSLEAKYNPLSYHNGSVWPHDNALIAYGFAKYELKQEAALVLQGLFEASMYVESSRLPELFCGFAKVRGQAPTLYPVACSPQAWSTATVFLLLQACLGISFGQTREGVLQISFSRPFLPEFLPEIQIKNLKVGNALLDLLITRHSAEDVGINILRRSGEVEVLIIK
jgi:glycogen debranching enzyme